MDRPSAPGSRGILNVKKGRVAGHARHLPAPELRSLVEHYWFVRWDRTGQEPVLAETLPHPSVHWITERRRSMIYGVPTGRFTRLLKGRGHTFGVKFRPGGFYPFLKSSVATLTDARIAPRDVFGAAGAAAAKALRALDAADVQNDDEMMALTDALLLAKLPAADPEAARVAEIVAAIVAGTAITRVEDVAARFGLSARALQRLFSRYVGVSPKWVIQRYRLHEAVHRVASGSPVNWSGLALDLGYFDQTHFIKDFKALVGRSPAEYARGMSDG